jgi:hypothetical protein
MTEPTRELKKQGLGFLVLVPGRWNKDMFAGICIANGCDRELAEMIAAELGRDRERMTTVRPIKEWSQFVIACKAVGVHVSDIPPR